MGAAPQAGGVVPGVARHQKDLFRHLLPQRRMAGQGSVSGQEGAAHVQTVQPHLAGQVGFVAVAATGTARDVGILGIHGVLGGSGNALLGAGPVAQTAASSSRKPTGPAPSHRSRNPTRAFYTRRSCRFDTSIVARELHPGRGKKPAFSVHKTGYLQGVGRTLV